MANEEFEALAEMKRNCSHATSMAEEEIMMNVVLTAGNVAAVVFDSINCRAQSRKKRPLVQRQRLEGQPLPLRPAQVALYRPRSAPAVAQTLPITVPRPGLEGLLHWIRSKKPS